jgi:hypothetical protein
LYLSTLDLQMVDLLSDPLFFHQAKYGGLALIDNLIKTFVSRSNHCQPAPLLVEKTSERPEFSIDTGRTFARIYGRC